MTLLNLLRSDYGLSSEQIRSFIDDARLPNDCGLDDYEAIHLSLKDYNMSRHSDFVSTFLSFYNRQWI